MITLWPLGHPSLLDFFLSHHGQSFSVSFADLCPALLVSVGLSPSLLHPHPPLGTSSTPRAFSGLMKMAPQVLPLTPTSLLNSRFI